MCLLERRGESGGNLEWSTTGKGRGRAPRSSGGPGDWLLYDDWLSLVQRRPEDSRRDSGPHEHPHDGDVRGGQPDAAREDSPYAAPVVRDYLNKVRRSKYYTASEPEDSTGVGGPCRGGGRTVGIKKKPTAGDVVVPAAARLSTQVFREWDMPTVSGLIFPVAMKSGFSSYSFQPNLYVCFDQKGGDHEGVIG